MFGNKFGYFINDLKDGNIILTIKFIFCFTYYTY